MELQIFEVDVVGICSILHHCTGCQGSAKRCCESYEVTIDTSELSNLVGCMPLASRYSDHLQTDTGYKNVFEQISRDLYSIDTNEGGTCVFAYRVGDRTLCSLHTVAEELKIPFTKAKPKSCLLWPLAVFEGEIGVLSIHDDVFDYGCNLRNKRNPREALSLCPSISKNIEMVFGFEFKNALREAANKGLHRTSIPLRGTLTSEP